MTSARTDLLGELPILAQLKAPDTDPGVKVLCERASWLAQDNEFRKGADWLASKLKVAFVSVNDTDCEIWCQRRRQRRRQRRQ